jgi:pescadillo protein
LKYPVIFDSKKLSDGEYLSAVTNIAQNNEPETVEDINQNIQKELNNAKDFKLKKISKEKMKSLNSAIKNINEEDMENSEDNKGENQNPELKTNEDKEEPLDDFGDEETKKMFLEQKTFSELFKNCVFWISREVPKDSLEFVIKSFGGQVVWDGEGSFIKEEKNEAITHHIIDRGAMVSNPIVEREYVQPQYVYDCINSKVLLPVDKYGPGCKLPPHLSPFVDYDKEGYVPEYKKELDQYYKKVNNMELDDNGGNDIVPIEDISDEENDEERYQRELKEEKETKDVNENNTKKRKRKDSFNEEKVEEEDQAKMAISLIPRKRRRLLQRIEYGKNKKKDETDKRILKKEKLESGDAKIVNGVIQYNTI